MKSCTECQEAHQGKAWARDMAKTNCKECGKMFDTGRPVPAVCPDCSEENNMCAYCGVKLGD